MELPNFKNLEILFQHYCQQKSKSLNSEQSLLSEEALRTLEDLQHITDQIIDLNTQLVSGQKQLSKQSINALQDARNKDPKLDKYFKENPNLKLENIKVGYSPGAIRRQPKEDQFLLTNLRLQITQFYHMAHRLVKIISQLPDLGNFKCKPITIVRNQLIEHPEGNSSKVLYDSFGYSMIHGPFIKPLRVGDQADRHKDDGFYPNAEIFIHDLSVALKKAIHGHK